MANSSPRQAGHSSSPEPKIFDVTRPGRTPVSATSRPVIVGHKPQVKDPMMSKDADDQKRSLMNANQKITVQPMSGVGGTTMDAQDKSQPTTTDHDEQPAPINTPLSPTLDSSLIGNDSQGAEPKAPDGDTLPKEDATDTPQPWTPTDQDLNGSAGSQDTTPAPLDTGLDEKPEMPDTSGNNDLSSDDLAAMNTPSTPPTPLNPSDTTPGSMPETPTTEVPTPSDSSSPFATPPVPPISDQKPLPQFPEEHPDHDMIVSHHSHGTGMTVLWVAIIVVIALIIFNFLLDLEIITIDSFPHTDFL